MKIKVTLFSITTILCSFSIAQTNDSSEALYQWKNQKSTEFQSGYVVLKSGKKLEGMISLKGSYSNVQEVNYQGDGKDVSFPVSALQSYGLNSKEQPAQEVAASGPVSDTPENQYEWRDGGVIMNKKVYNSVPRDGYVVLNSGKKFEGQLRVQKRDENPWNFQVKTNSSKEKFKAEEVAFYGLTVNEGQIAQSNLSGIDASYFPGSVSTASGTFKGEIAIIKTSFYSKNVLFKTPDGQFSEYTPETAIGFTQIIAGNETPYTSLDGVFVEDEFNGKVFRLYRNPNPTTINRFATGLVKTTVQAGTEAAAAGIVNKDAKDNNYSTNMDSVIRVSTKEELIALRDKFVQLGGYSTADELIENSGNESLVNNVNALELAIAGREFAESDDGGIYNKEWIILNKKTGEKTVVYRSDFDKLIEGLLFGCYDYLSLEKSAQKDYQKWNNLLQTVKYIDKCY